MRDTIMEALDLIAAIRRQIDRRADLASVRGQIIGLLFDSLKAKEHALEDWEKTHFSNAIGALALNIHSAHQPTFSWLRLSLADLERAVAPPERRIANYRSPDPSMRDVTYAQLMGAVESLGLEMIGSGRTAVS
jgi:hypothetical protein